MSSHLRFVRPGKDPNCLQMLSVNMPIGQTTLAIKEVNIYPVTILPAKSDSDVTFCLQSYQGLRIDKSLVY